MEPALKYGLALLFLAVLLAAAYCLRLALKGPVRFERIDRQGGSIFLSKSIMAFGYWLLEPVARLLIFLRITPNQITWTSLVCGFLAGAFLAAGRFGLGATCAAVSGLFDCLDGMAARLSGVASDAGEVLDAAVDRYVEFFFLSGLVIYYREIPLVQAFALLALLGSFMVSYSTAKAEALKLAPPRSMMRRPERAVYLTLGAALSALTIPYLETPWRASIWIGYPMVAALALVAIAANTSAIARLWSIARAARRRDQALAETTTEAPRSRFDAEEKISQPRAANV